MVAAVAARPRDVPVGVLRLGKYELISRIAVGGMAELFLARTTAQHGFEKLVAVKRILASHADDDQFIQMLLAEARLAATLHHPNIAQVYDVGDDDGTYFFAMEYVFGQDLRKIVRAIQGAGKWLAPEHILQIVIGTAAGLHYAHDKEGSDGSPLGIVHRDVSPSNVLVSYDGGVKLVDFGIARVTAMSTTTGQGVQKGKVPYMSPEQCRGERLDRRSDVFSLGIMLWELTLRRRLYSGDNDVVIAGRICNEDAAAPRSLVADYPPDLSAIVVKALARDRERRYASAQELQLALEEYAREHKLLLSSARLGSFMTELFAAQIQASKADLRHRLASSTGLFPVAEQTGSSFTAPAVSGSRSASVADDDAPTIARDSVELGSGVTRLPAPTSARRRGLVVAGGALAAVLLGVALFGGGGEEPAAPPATTPEPAVVVVPPVVAAEAPPAVDRDIIVADDPPTPPVATSPKTAPTSKSSKKTAAKTAKKRGGKTTTKKSSNWDPDSPLPPP